MLFSFAHVSSAKNDNAVNSLKDSINYQLQNCKSDTAQMRSIFTVIRKNRRTLKADYKPLLEYYVEKSKSLNYAYGEMKSLDFLGLQERYDENYGLAIKYHLRSLKFALQFNDSSQLCYNYNNLGQAYRKQDLNILAIKYFHKALAIQEKMGQLKSISFTHNTLGATYLSQDDFDKALFHLNKSAIIAKERNDKRTLSYNYGSLGEIMLRQNKPDEALAYFNKALLIKNDLNYTKGKAVTYHLLGQAWYLKKDYKQSISWFTKAIETHKKYNSQRYLSHCYAYLGKIKLALNQMDSANLYLNKAEEYATEVHSIENLILISETRTRFYKEKQNWRLAMQALNVTNSLKDSIKESKYQKEIQTLEIGYQTEKKEQQIEILSAENKIKNQRLRLGIAIIIILVLGLAFAYYVSIIRKRNAKLNQEKLQQQLLKSQMNPHFIFNALGSIQNFMYQNDSKSAARYMGNFASLTRSILNNSSADFVTLDEEISTLKNYLELELMRVNNAFVYNMEYSEDLETEFINIPPMLLQPFIENSIKHGVKDMDSGGIITVRFKEENNLILVEVEDNGAGINSSKNEKQSNHISMATGIFNKRISILKTSYPHLPSPLIEDLSQKGKKGTLIKVFLPILN